MFEENATWYPENYSPNLSLEDWKNLLLDKNIFTNDSFKLIKNLQESGESSFTRLCEKYGEDMSFYTTQTRKLSGRIAEKTGCPLSKREDGSVQYWAILYLGHKEKNNGGFVFKLRDELAEALNEIDLSNIKLYFSEKFFFIIDEINRGNLSKIFGELLMLIETDKRGEEKILRSVVDYDILPMLEEYWFDNIEKVEEWKNKLRGVFND